MKKQIVFKLYSDATDLSYYGYREGNIETNIDIFTKTVVVALQREVGVKGRQVDGAQKWYQENDCNVDNIQLLILDICGSEEEALLARNHARTINSDSITGTTPYPLSVSKRATELFPELVDHYTHMKNIHLCKTARSAFRKYKCFSFVNDIKPLSDEYGKKVIADDLDNLSPIRFKVKYNLNFINE